MTAPLFLSSHVPLRANDAVAALLVLPDGRYVMQLRDPLPHIFYPDHWSCFGGGVEPGEEPLEALKRELFEELAIRPDFGARDEFTRFDFDLTNLKQKRVYRIWYEVALSHEMYAAAELREGAEMRAFTAEEIFAQPRITPYDAFAVWLHASRARLARA